MKVIKYLTIIIVLFLSAASLFAQSLQRNSLREKPLDSFLISAVNKYKIPGLAVAIVDGQDVLYSFCSGQTDSHDPITANTPFLLGSTSKTFTALAVMCLVETGKVDLDEPIKTYLPDFHIRNQDYENKITVRHLLNHTSGLSGNDLPEYSIGANNLTEELSPIINCNPSFHPGTRYEYCNSKLQDSWIAY